MTAAGGSLISTAPVPDGTSAYEVKSTLTLTQSGGTYVTYLRASADALSGPGAQGTFLAVELQNPLFSGGTCTAGLAVSQRVGGVVTALGSTAAPCRNGMVIRAVYADGTNTAAVWVDDVLYLSPGVGSFASGMPGVGVRAAPAGNQIGPVQLGPLDRAVPNAVGAATLRAAASSNQVDLQWQAPAQSGVGIGNYVLYRNGAYLGTTYTTSMTDATVQPSTSYTYEIYAMSYHLKFAGTQVTVGTPATPVLSRRVGVRANGAYWGGMGENIDLLSGNLNFSLPLLRAQGRGGWGVGFNLTYNSQNWKYENSDSWNIGQDVGYGYGWKLLAGALTPQHAPGGVLTGYLLMDATGATYRLDVNTGGVWTSRETYVTYESGANRLYFNDGSFWVMGCVSAGTEADAGTMYPTLMQDSNGNQIKVRYVQGNGAGGPDTSARISEIEDVRARPWTGTFPNYQYRTYRFTYTTGRLTAIVNEISTSEGYTFTYEASRPLISPFDSSGGYGDLVGLDEVRIAGLNLKHQFDADTSRHLTKVVLPYGGHLRWQYGVWQYAGGRKQTEVTTRWASANGTLESAYALGHDDASDDGTRALHVNTKLDDPGLVGGRTWVFAQTGATAGLVTELRKRVYNGTTVVASDTFTWEQDAAGRWYIGRTDSTQGSKTARTDQTLDVYGNVLETKLYDWNSSTVKRVYTNAYFGGTQYLSRYIRNRLSTSSVTEGSVNLPLVTNTYDGTAVTEITGEVRQRDTSYGTSFLYRGNLTGVTSMGTVVGHGYDVGGNRVSTTVNGVTSTATYQSGTNYAAPGVLTANGLNTELVWNTALSLTQNTGPNGEVSGTVYDQYARPSSSTSKTGAVTQYTYAKPETQWTVKATRQGGAGRWSLKTLDGFGRVVKQEAGYGSTTVSVTETVYEPCACSPVGKVKKVSMPRSPQHGNQWNEYQYDALGRTVAVTAPGGKGSKTYAYVDNTVTVTDEAGKWKTYTLDVFGKLERVDEPKPAADTGHTGTYVTAYVYDLLGRLTNVTMLRGSVTQVRQFGYGNPPGTHLLTSTNPESGTVTYTYNANGTLATRVDAKGLKTEYGYDAYRRLIQVRRYPSVTEPEQESARVDLSYDTNPYVPGYSGPSAGRLTARRYVVNGVTFTEMYGYTGPGQVAKKKLRVSKYGADADLEGQWEYNEDGQIKKVTYPGGGVYEYGFDAMGRLKDMKDPNDPYQQWIVSNATYGPAGELVTMAGVVNESRSYNERLQLTGLNGVTFSYDQQVGGQPRNNGRLMKEIASGETVVYQYECAGRPAWDRG